MGIYIIITIIFVISFFINSYIWIKRIEQIKKEHLYELEIMDKRLKILLNK